MNFITSDELAYRVPHADLIRAVLDGKVVQYRALENEPPRVWTNPLWTPGAMISMLVNQAHRYEFRLKPETVTKEQALAALNKVFRTWSDDDHDLVRRFIEEQP